MSTQTYFRQDIKPAILRHLQTAQDSVYIAMYCFNDKELYNQLLLLAQRGVKIKIVLDKQQHAQQNLDFSALIQADNAKVYFSETILHHKFCIIDQKTVINGSANWTFSGFNSNIENVTIHTNDYSTTQTFNEEFELVITYSEHCVIDLAEINIDIDAYDKIWNLVEDRYLVRKGNYRDGKYGFLDKKGYEIIPCIYDYADNFSEKLARVRAGDKWGFIDKSGKNVLPCLFHMVGNFTQGLAEVKKYKNGKWGFINICGEEIIICVYDKVYPFFKEGLALVSKSGKWGFVDKQGKELTDFIYDINIFLPEISEGLIGIKKGKKYGFIDTRGKEVVPFIYDSVGNFREGFAYVLKDRKWGFLDAFGNEVFSFEYDRADNFINGKAEVQKNWIKGYIDRQGNFYPLD